MTVLRGVDLSKVDRNVLLKNVKALKLKSDTSIDGMVATLADHLVKLFKNEPEKLLKCDKCGGSSDVSFAACPYCGSTDEEQAEPAAAEAPPVSQQTVVDARPRKATRPKPKPEAQGPGLAKPKKNALAVVHSAEIVSTKQLDDKVAEINQTQIDNAVNHWKLGRLLEETWELYKLRTEGGKPKYANWSQFVQAELKISTRYATDLIGVSRVFTQEDIRKVGVTKLRIMARIPDEAKRQSIVELAKNQLNGKPELSRKDIEKEARAGGLPPARKTLDGRVNTEESVRKRAEKAKARADAKGVTVVIQPGRVTIPLYSGNSKDLVPAFSVADEPEGVLDMLNGVKARFRVVSEADGLKLVVEHVREAEASLAG